MVLDLIQVTKSFGKKSILKSLDLDFEHGVYGLLGPNGSGKTTLMRCITQLYPIKEGSIKYHGQDIRTNADYRKHIGYLPQKFGLFRELTVSEMMQMMADLCGVSKNEIKSESERCIELVNLQDRLDSKVKTLSGGMIRRLGIAQAILGNPEIIIFDEPTAGLDPEERLRFKSIVSKLKGDKTILISTHIVDDVEALCDRILIMGNGKILANGTSSEIQKFASGKVYEIKEEKKDLLEETYYVQQQYERDGHNILRIISNKSQPDATLVKATTEDGYICVLKAI